MRSLFVMSLICSVASLIAVFGSSAMTIVPAANAETERAVMMAVAGVFLLVWLGVAFWARPRRTAMVQPSRWLSHSLTGLSIVYVLAVFLLMMG